MAVVTDLLIAAKNGTEKLDYYPIAKNIPININYNLADVREPDKRKASFSKTITLYGSNDINKLFENIFSVNVTTQYFNKNLKTPCKYIVDGIQNFKGDLQLIKVNIKPDKSIEYECSILGEGGSLFVDIGDKLITGNSDSADDLDFSAYNHTYDRSTQISTRSNAGTGLGVLYPFIDNGTNGGSDTVWNVKNFIPCFSVYEYCKKIIEATGRTFTSSILTSTEVKNQIIYPNINTIALSSAQLANRQFYVGLNANFTQVSTNPYTLVHDNEAGQFFDVGGQNNIGTGLVTINDSGYYNVASKFVARLKFTHSDVTVAYAKFPGIKSYNDISRSVPLSSLAVNFMPHYGVSGIVQINTNTWETFTNQVATGEILLNQGDVIYNRVTLDYDSTAAVEFYTAGNVLVTTGTPTYTIEVISGNSGASFYALATQKTLIEGNAILANNALPQKIKQKDFLKSIVQGLNLFIDVDPTNPNNLIIESFTDFYNSDILDYENKTDLAKEQSINPNILEGKKYIYTYKEDKDFWNTEYKNLHNEVFGIHEEEVENDFIKSDKKNELIFSPTPNVANYGLGIAHPRIYTKDGLTIKSLAPNIRWLYCSGVKQTSNPYTYKQLGQSDLVTSDYLFASHTDDAFNPTLDMNFGLPKSVFYTYPNAYFTTNNLYNRYHADYLNNIINRDAKFVIKNLWLSPKDIYNFNFRKRLFIDGAYYIVNKIENYNPLELTSTKVELIKLLESNVFTPSSILISSSTTVNAGADTFSARLNTGLNVGSGNQNKGTNCVAIGDNIIIPESCSNVTVIGENITVPEDTTNFIYINGQVISTVLNDKAVVKSVSTNYNTKAYDDTILVTTGATDKTITLQYGNIENLESAIVYELNATEINYEVTKRITIKKVDSGAGNIIIDGDGALIDGFATQTLTTQYESLTLQWDGTNWNII